MQLKSFWVENMEFVVASRPETIPIMESRNVPQSWKHRPTKTFLSSIFPGRKQGPPTILTICNNEYPPSSRKYILLQWKGRGCYRCRGGHMFGWNQCRLSYEIGFSVKKFRAARALCATYSPLKQRNVLKRLFQKKYSEFPKTQGEKLKFTMKFRIGFPKNK